MRKTTVYFFDRNQKIDCDNKRTIWLQIFDSSWINFHFAHFSKCCLHFFIIDNGVVQKFRVLSFFLLFLMRLLLLSLLLLMLLLLLSYSWCCFVMKDKDFSFVSSFFISFLALLGLSDYVGRVTNQTQRSLTCRNSPYTLNVTKDTLKNPNIEYLLRS